jgi:hypothetical protein
MALPSKEQFRNFLTGVWDNIVKEISNYPKLSTLQDTMLECKTDKGLDLRKLDAFFAEEAYRKKQAKISALMAKTRNAQEIGKLQILESVLEQLRVSFTFLKNPLPFEAADRTLTFASNIFEMKRHQMQTYLAQVHLSLEDFQDKKQSSILRLAGIKRHTQGERIIFILGQGTTLQQLFDRAFLELDPAYPVEIMDGTPEQCETLAFLCMANNIPWTCRSHPLAEAKRLETAIRKLSKTIDTSNPAALYRALPSVDSAPPNLQDYYRTKCLAQDKRRQEDFLSEVDPDEFKHGGSPYSAFS